MYWLGIFFLFLSPIRRRYCKLFVLFGCFGVFCDFGMAFLHILINQKNARMNSVKSSYLHHHYHLAPHTILHPPDPYFLHPHPHHFNHIPHPHNDY